MMLLHNIKVALRNIKKQGFYALLNILGLSVGLVLSLFVLLLVKHELSYDKSFTDSHRIYRMATKGILGSNIINSATSPIPLGQLIDNDERVEDVVQFIPGANNVVTFGDNSFNETGFIFGGANFFSLFDIPFEIVESPSVLNNPREVVITKSTAKKYFGNENPVGKIIERDNIRYTITGICNDLPSSTHFDFGFIASLSTVDEILMRKGDTAYVKKWKSDWLYLNCYTYFKLKEGVRSSQFEDIINKQKEKLIVPQINSIVGNEQWEDSIKLDFFSQPIESIHFSSHLDGELTSNTKPVYMYLFVFVAAFVILTTCVNFINLTTAKLRTKYNEVGYRQLMGAARWQLMGQFLTEAFVYSFGAMFIAMVLLELLLPFLNGFFDLSLEFDFFRGWIDLSGIIVMLLIVGFLAGSFPAYFLSGKKTERLISGEYKISAGSIVLRGILVASQWSIAMFLVLLASAMWWQVDFVQNRNPGFNTDNIIVIERGYAVDDYFKEFKNDVQNLPGVSLVTACSNLPGDDYYQMPFVINADDGDKVVMLPFNYVEQDFMEVLGLTLITGRFLDKSLGDSLGVVINEEAVKQLNFRKPLKEKVELLGHKDKNLNIVGVVNDFQYESYFSKINTLALVLMSGKMRSEYLLIKAESETDINEIKTVWDNYSSEAPFVWTYLKDRLNKLYEEDVRIAKIIAVFALLSLFVAILGLIALVTFIMDYKIYSFSVRKIIGASGKEIIKRVFSMIWWYVLFGVFIAVLPAYIAVGVWGQSYAYFDFIGFPVFLLWALVLMALASLVAFYQTYKTVSNRNLNDLTL